MELSRYEFTIFSYLVSLWVFSHAVAYDPFDPYGSINIKWDIFSWTPDGYVAGVTIQNFQMYRPIASPGWTFGWTWAEKEVIWSMVGAQAADQGDCSNFKENIPHCCTRNPAIIDLFPGIPDSQRFHDCCKGGVLASWGQDPSAAISAFQLSVGLSGTSNDTVRPPENFYFLGPGQGYTCGRAAVVASSAFLSADGRRRTQAMMTWTTSCTYSPFLESKQPKCCVSLSSFYNPVITHCPSCACGSRDTSNCVANDAKISSVLRPGRTEDDEPGLRCTEHMCPIRVHWHVKANYPEYWRVKITITNFKNRVNYTHWTLVVEHPNLKNLTKVYSFAYEPLDQYRLLNDTGMFYGIKYYSDQLNEAGPTGHVQTELLLKKDKKKFTLGQGWVFPHKIYFNGDECKMPFPDLYPSLPNSGYTKSIFRFGLAALWLLLLIAEM